MFTGEKVWLACQPVDMRCGIDRLTQFVTDHLSQPWQSEATFVFCNRSRTRIKLLRWDKHGVWLGIRRLHRGRFVWPNSSDQSWMLTAEQFSWLLKGINWQKVEGENLFSWR